MQRFTQASQMYPRAPAISLATSCSLLPQNEQRSFCANTRYTSFAFLSGRLLTGVPVAA